MDKVQDNLRILDPPVAAMLKRKAEMLKNAVKKQFQVMLTWYPNHLQRESTVGRADRDNIGRNSYSNDIMAWLALTLLRHWVSFQVADDQTHHAPDLGKSVIDVVMQGGEAYLDKAQLTKWHKFFPMSARGSAVVENKLAEDKESIK
ncbi:hypothetical protein LTR53_019494, partial [Teratosphaeriaceae sp. CCFEE 6253]